MPSPLSNDGEKKKKERGEKKKISAKTSGNSCWVRHVVKSKREIVDDRAIHEEGWRSHSRLFGKREGGIYIYVVRIKEKRSERHFYESFWLAKFVWMPSEYIFSRGFPY